MKRKIIGIVKTANDEPVISASGYFILSKPSYDAIAIYNTSKIPFWTDKLGVIVDSQVNGDVGVYLVCNDSLDIPTTYNCVIGDGVPLVFTFVLPSGDTPISLQTLWQATIMTPDSRYISLLTYIDDKVDASILGLTIGQNRKLITETFTANQNLSALRIINLSSFTYADSTIIGNINLAKAFLETSVMSGNESGGVSMGTIQDNSWNWDITKPIFLGINGFLTQTIDDTFAFLQQVATPILSSKILVNFEEPIKL